MSKSRNKRRKMFISVLPEEKLEVALASDGRVQEYYVELLQQEKTKANIYKGVINNIDPALQAAFISYGAPKNGFLQVDEVHPEYYVKNIRPKKGYKYPPLHKVLKPNQEMLVQVVKEPAGTKGAFLTTYLSLAGRYFVLTLGREQTGISRQIEDEKERARLKSIVDDFNLGEGMGVIVRTVSVGQKKSSLSRDLQFLKRLWEDIRKKGINAKAPSLVYEEKGLAFRAVRDYLTSDISEIWVDDEETAQEVREVVSLLYPRRKKMVKFHDDPDQTLFNRFSLSDQIKQVYDREVPLPSGGRLVFDQTEALMAIDINSGKIGGETDFKEMALKTNVESALEIARQLSLRDIGGQIVIDFIEMRDKNHLRQVERTMRTALKTDKARTDVGRISKFGLMELVRQRIGSSAISRSTEPCPCCNGTGMQQTLEWQALQSLKQIVRMLKGKHPSSTIEYKTTKEIALYLLNNKREKLSQLEDDYNKTISIIS